MQIKSRRPAVIRGRTALGWKQLVHDRTRFAMAVAGVAFAVLLVFMQLGFMNMLFDTTVIVHRQLDADIVLLSAKARDIANAGTFPRMRFFQALGVEGVAEGEVLYAMNREWIKPTRAEVGERGQMLVLGVRPDFRAFREAGITAQQPRLMETGVALFDRGSRGDYRAFIAAVERGERPQTEIGGRTVTVDGLFRIGSSFGTEGVLIVSDASFFEFAPNRTPAAPSLGLIQVAAGRDVGAVVARIRARLGDGDDTMVMTMPQFIAHSRDRIRRDSPIAVVFGFGMAIGIVVGIVVVAQVLSADVHDHMAEYATFKAMGFTDGYLLGVVVEQSAILTVLGFIPGLLAALGLHQIVGRSVAMNMAMPVDRVLTVLALTAAMCAISGAIAMRRVRTADPADVF